MAQIRIDIASEFKEKGFKKASKSATALERQFKSLAKTFLAVFSTRQIIAFGRAAVKAFEQDELAARRLTTTLNNLNLGFEDPRVTKFISTIEAQTGVLDDELRPAMQSLLTTTGSVTKSQELLNLAIELSRGSGESLTTVANDLSKAYIGNTRSLMKYNLGLAKSELAGKSFAEVQVLLNKQYSGQNAAFLDTYAGRVNVLRVAYANMEETVGKGLVDAFTTLSGDKGIGGASKAITDFGDNLAYSIGGVVSYIQMLDRSISGIGLNPLIKFFLESQGPVQLAKSLIETGKQSAISPKPFTVGMSVSGASDLYTKQDRIRKKAEEEAAKRAKQLAALQKKAELEKQKRERLALARKRAATIFDIENIQIVAALQGKIDGEQRARLVTLLALNTENYTAAEKLADIVVRLNAPALSNLGVLIESGDSVDDLIKKLITSQAKLAGLQLMAEDFPELENPFEEWNMTLDEILAKLLAMLELLAGGATGAGKIQSIKRPKQPSFGAGSGASDVEWMRMMDAMAKAGVPYVSDNQSSLSSQANMLASARYAAMQQSVNVYVSGNVTAERDLVSTITEQLYNQQKSGQQIVFSSTGL